MRLIHVPTGITREHPGPMKGINTTQLQQQWLEEIEQELLRVGLSQHVVAPYRQKNKWQQRSGDTP